MSLSPCQEEAMQALQGEENVFLTGGAGTGKSYLVREFLKSKSRKEFPVLASTGAAAVLVGGRTFHSFFGLGIMEGGFDTVVAKAVNNRRVVNRISKIDGFVIDEVSMIPAEALQAAQVICRYARDCDEPWGGIKVVAVGDFAQLPPVSKSPIRPWAFRSRTWQLSNFVSFELKSIMRTDDKDFIRILNSVRQGECNQEVSDFLDSRLCESAVDFAGTRLFPRRNQAEKYNLYRLDELENELEEFETLYTGQKRYVDQLKKSAPIPEVLKLKKDCLVMMRQNDPKQRWVNGSLGHVRDFFEDMLLIELFNGRVIELERAAFSMVDADGNGVAAAENFPVNLAYATTIHKAQGATFDRLMVNLENLWEPGQAYVAMSRVTQGAGLLVQGWNPSSIKADPLVKSFLKA